MPPSNRATMINKTVKIVKKHFKQPPIPAERSLIEHLLYACCLENSPFEAADEVYTSLSRGYFDWNEVRVSTVRELSEVMKPLYDPPASAKRLKRVLQSLFETHYSFDLESLKKQNIGQSVKQLTQYKGATPFVIAYVTQNALGGHSIPVNQGLLHAMHVIGVISDAEAAQETIPGLERAIPKTKGVEIGALLHQMGVEFRRSPFAPAIRKILIEIEPDCKPRLPKRPTKKKAVKVEKIAVKGQATPSEKTSPQSKPKEEPRKPEKKGVKKSEAAKTKKSPKPNSAQPAKKRTTKKKVIIKKTASKKKKVPAAKQATKKGTKKKTTNKRLAKRKPR
jgi:hypothetical protein